MPRVICEPCVGVKDTSCVDVCPVSAIHPRPNEPEFERTDQLFIDPSRCSDCGACVAACPKSAIYAIEDVPTRWYSYIQKNADYFT